MLETCGVTKAEFIFILSFQKDQQLICARKHLSTKEQLAIFLSCMHKGLTNRQLQERFQRSGSTIHEVFHDIQSSLVACSEEWIVSPTGRFQRGLMSTLHYPFFKHCVGAIDGTHIPVVLRIEDQDSHRCHKLKTTQNVMCCVDWDTRVRYVLAGWEGSAHDMRVFKDAHTSHDFTIPHGKFVLADAGYSTDNGVLAPYKKVKYHLGTWGKGDHRRKPRSPKKLFNYLHAKARNVVEQTFGFKNNTWHILKEIPLYSLETQAHTIIACCVLHNMRIGKLSNNASRPLSNGRDRYNAAAYRSMKDFRVFLTKDMC